jgi:elongation factor P
MKINATEIRVGMILEYKDDLWEVLKTQHVKPGKGGAFAQIEMKSLNKNTKLNERFRSSETVEKATLEETKFNFLYEDDTNYYFMNPKTFDQINIKKNIVGEKGRMLTENLEVSINFYNENPLSVDLPNQITSKVETTDAALKGQTVSSSYKPATLDNGINIQVPPFIESGDKIVVDTRTIEYVKKI